MGKPSVSGTEPLEELEEMILSRFSKVRLGQGQEPPTGPVVGESIDRWESKGVTNVTPPKTPEEVRPYLGSWWFS